MTRLSFDNCGSSLWSQRFSYDAFGDINKTNNGGAYTSAPAYNDATNQIVSGASAAYDANGNQTQTNFAGGLVYDAEHHGVSSNGTTMSYDALGRLVEFGTTPVGWGPSGEKLGLLQQGVMSSTLGLPGGGEALYSGNSLTAIRHKDWLGSSRLSTTWANAIYSKTAYAPFGETYNTAGASDNDFTGQTKDSVASLTDFPARRYDSNMGRFISPDPSGLTYASLINPQSLNLYSYVQNNPLSNIDPSGL